MKQFIALVICFGFLLISPSNKASDTGWLNQIGGKGAEVVMDSVGTTDGRVCTTGTFWSSAVFGKGTHQETLKTSEAQDIFVACYNATGELQFARRFGAARGDEPRALVASADGGLLVAGHFSKTIGLTPATKLTTNNNADMFLTRLDQNGQIIWSKQFGGKLADTVKAMDISDTGEIVLAGTFEGTMFYLQAGKKPKINSMGARDAVILKLNASGDIQWVRSLGGKGYDEATAVSMQKNGGILVAGTFQKAIVAGDKHLVSNGHKDIFVLALDAEGNQEWLQHAGGIRQDNVRGIIEDSLGRVVIAGDFQSSIKFSTTRVLESLGSTDVFFARYSSTGELQVADSMGGQQIDQIYAITADAQGGFLLTGHYQGTVDLAPGPQVLALHSPSANNSSGFLLALDEHGQARDAITLGGSGVEMGLGVTQLENGKTAVVGVFNNDFTVADYEPLKKRGKTDVFVLAMHFPSLETVSAIKTP